MSNPLNENKSVKVSRDGQELPNDVGRQICQMVDQRVYNVDPAAYVTDESEPVTGGFGVPRHPQTLPPGAPLPGHTMGSQSGAFLDPRHPASVGQCTMRSPFVDFGPRPWGFAPPFWPPWAGVPSSSYSYSDSESDSEADEVKCPPRKSADTVGKDVWRGTASTSLTQASRLEAEDPKSASTRAGVGKKDPTRRSGSAEKSSRRHSKTSSKDAQEFLSETNEVLKSQRRVRGDGEARGDGKRKHKDEVCESKKRRRDGDAADRVTKSSNSKSKSKAETREKCRDDREKVERSRRSRRSPPHRDVPPAARHPARVGSGTTAPPDDWYGPGSFPDRCHRPRQQEHFSPGVRPPFGHFFWDPRMYAPESVPHWRYPHPHPVAPLDWRGVRPVTN